MTNLETTDWVSAEHYCVRPPEELNSNDLKTLAKYFSDAHDKKKISRETLELLVELLLSYYIGSKWDARLVDKSIRFERRFWKYIERLESV